jgi:hypothetical protein
MTKESWCQIWFTSTPQSQTPGSRRKKIEVYFCHREMNPTMIILDIIRGRLFVGIISKMLKAEIPNRNVV